MTMKISVVIAAYNEQDNVKPLLEGISESLNNFEYEVLYVDDGSSDDTVKNVLEVNDPHVTLIELRKNFGQSAALRAGMDHAGGEYIVFMDADMQNDPSDIPSMLETLQQREVDVVAGQRSKRKDRVLSRTLPSLIANWLIRMATGLKTKDFGCSLRVFRAEIAKGLSLYGEMHRFIPVLLHLEGARVIQVPVRHHPRNSGQSKYNLSRSYKVLADLFFIIFFDKFMHRPMQLFGVGGLLLALIGVGLNFYLLVLKIMGRDIWGKPLMILGLITFLGGIQLITLGILSEILMRTYFESQNKKPYSIRKVVHAGEEI